MATGQPSAPTEAHGTDRALGAGGCRLARALALGARRRRSGQHRRAAHGAGKPGFAEALEATTGYPIRDRLGEIACPTLVVWGELDRLVPVRDAAEFQWLIPGARKIVYDGTGHLVMLERPDRFNADLRAFLAESSGAARPRSGLRMLAK